MAEVETLAALLTDTARRLRQALVLEQQEARLEARVLVGHALGVDHAWLIAHDRDPITSTQRHAIESLVARRMAGEPVAYILGEREFFGLTFAVTPAVLIPRPDTELLVEVALQRLPEHAPRRILDLGTGSGAVAIALALRRPLAQVVAVDASAAALAVAQANARRLGADNVHCIAGDWYGGLDVKKFDMIVSNPPYIAAGDPHLASGDLRFEPMAALQSGDGGLADIARIVAGAPAHLSQGGWLLFEHGYNQGEACQRLLRQAGWSQVKLWTDLSGQPRVSGGQRP